MQCRFAFISHKKKTTRVKRYKNAKPKGAEFRLPGRAGFKQPKQEAAKHAHNSPQLRIPAAENTSPNLAVPGRWMAARQKPSKRKYTKNKRAVRRLLGRAGFRRARRSEKPSRFGSCRDGEVN